MRDRKKIHYGSIKVYTGDFAGADQDPDKSCRVYFSPSGGSLFFTAAHAGGKGRGDRNDHIEFLQKDHLRK